jgi:menaquinone-dependent protoporphyrinogen oxidase
MANIYIPYGSVEGQTAQIAEYIAELIRSHGHEAEAVAQNLSGSPPP